MKSKKSQIKMFESIAVLMIFVFIIAIGLKFYVNSQFAYLKDAERKFTDLDSVKVSVILSNLPELSCSMQGVSKYACIDLFKVKSWNYLLKQGDKDFFNYYSPLVGYSEIYVERIYPKTGDDVWVIYNASRDSGFDYARVPVILHNPLSKKNELGILHIKTYYG